MTWHYQGTDGQEHEVDESMFATLVSQGEIEAGTMVWAPGMEAWQSANSVAPDLFPPPADPHSPSHSDSQDSPSTESNTAQKISIPAVIPAILVVPIAIISGGGAIPWGIAGGAIGGIIAISRSPKHSVGIRVWINIGISIAAWILFVGVLLIFHADEFKRGFERGMNSAQDSQSQKREERVEQEPQAPPQPKREGHIDLIPDQSKVPDPFPFFATNLVGGKGGGLRIFTRDGDPLLGIDYKPGKWDRRDPVPTDIVGVFSPDQEPFRNDTTRILAREGFAVFGLEAEFSGAVYALRLHFARLHSDGSLNLTDTYDSGWIGNTIEGSQQMSWKASKRPMVGVITNAGMITDAIGGLFHADDSISRSLDGGPEEKINVPR